MTEKRSRQTTITQRNDAGEIVRHERNNNSNDVYKSELLPALKATSKNFRIPFKDILIGESDNNVEKDYNLLHLGPMEPPKSSLIDVIVKDYNINPDIASVLAVKFHAEIKNTFNKINNNKENLSVPLKAPELFSERADKSETPVLYYERVWKKYSDAGLIFTDNLSKLDPKLVPAIRVYCTRNNLSAKDYLPPSSRDRTRIQAELGDPASIIKLREAERQRLWRKQKLTPNTDM